MIYTRIQLKNYIGIYNGLGLNKIDIDFTRCKSGIIRIIGDNGSGKSTLVNALTPLPDDNSAFIPNVKASKMVSLFDEISGETYIIEFIHNVNDKGERTTTQGYIRKMYPDGSTKELNPTGKISSCKELIYSELELDSNFIALSKMSTTNKGLAGMIPSERKRYVNAIVSETQAFTDIYKKFLKKSNFYKDTIKRITSKIDSIGKPEALAISLEQVSGTVNKTETLIQKLTDEIATQKAIISTIPASDNIMSLNARKIELEKLLKEYEVAVSDLNNNDIIANIDTVKQEKAITEEKIRSNTETINSLIAKQEEDSIKLQDKSAKLAYMDVANIDEIHSQYDESSEKIHEYKHIISELGINPDYQISKEDYINAIDALERVRDIIKNSCSNISSNDIPEVLGYRNNSLVLKEKIESIKNKLEQQKQFKAIYEQDKHMYYTLNDIAKVRVQCSQKQCPMQDMIEEKLKSCTVDYNDELTDMLKAELSRLETIYDIVGSLNTIMVLVKSCKKVLTAIGLDNIIESEAAFIQDICNHKAYTYIDKVTSKAVDYNILDMYRYEIERNNKLLEEIEDYRGKEAFLDEVKFDIDNLNSSLTKTMNTINELNEANKNYKFLIGDYNNQLNNLNLMLSEFNQYIILKEELTSIESEVSKSLEFIEKISTCERIINENEIKLKTAKTYLEQQKSQENEITFNIKMLNQYLKEMEEVKANYDKVELIKKYTNPSQGGIQNLFIAMHMNKIIVDVNNILGTLFNGSLMLQPFVINETEFRIPVSVESGIPHDDINSLSAGQTALISMIITAALSKQASSKLNVFSSDELDGPLDPKNRRFFLDTLKTVRALTNSHQSIMISHNSEISNDECDVILLKNDNSDGPNVNGNVIWSYYEEF